MKRTVDMHQAGVVDSGTNFGAGVEHLPSLVGEHCGGDVRILDRKGASEAAALVDFGKVDQLHAPHITQQPKRDLSEMKAAYGVATGVVRHTVGIRCPDIG